MPPFDEVPEEETEIREAFTWTCNECGRDHFGHVIQRDANSDEAEAFSEEFGLQPWETPDRVELSIVPSYVECPHCQKTYKTKPE